MTFDILLTVIGIYPSDKNDINRSNHPLIKNIATAEFKQIRG